MTAAPAALRPGASAVAGPVRRPDRPLPGLLRARLVWWRTGRRRRRDLQRPALTLRRLGRLRLPGTTAETELHEARDAYDRPFGLVVVPDTGHASIALAVRPPTPDLLGAEGAELWIADLGVWLALLAHEPQVAGCTVSVVPDAGAGDPLALAVTVQLTWRTRGPQGRTDPAALAAELGGRLPHLVHGLGRCGVGTARPLRAAELVRAVAAAYDPADPSTADHDDHDDRDDRDDDRAWPDAGPRLVAEAWDRLRHDSATSLTWCLSDVPPDQVLSGVLAQLTSAHARTGSRRTRVALLYRPAPGRPGAGDRSAPLPDPPQDWTGLAPGVLAAPIAGPEAGAGHLHGEDAVEVTPPVLTSLVTVSVTGHPDTRDAALDDAVRGVLVGVAPTLRPWLRPLYGSQAAAFAAAVPAGTLLDVHTLAPAVVRETGS